MMKWLVIVSLATLSACSATQPMDKKPGMVSLSPNIAVDSAMSWPRRQQLLDDIERAKTRIAQFFGGDMQSTPMIHACVTEPCFQAYSEAHPKIEAKALGASTILLAEAGCNETVITHEMTHIELHHRLGKSISLHRIPMWFDEGLSILASNDPRYTRHINVLPAAVKRELTTETQWMSAIEDYQKPYERSYHVVKQWHDQVGTAGLLQSIERIKQTGRFSLVPHDDGATSDNVAQQ